MKSSVASGYGSERLMIDIISIKNKIRVDAYEKELSAYETCLKRDIHHFSWTNYWTITITSYIFGHGQGILR